MRTSALRALAAAAAVTAACASNQDVPRGPQGAATPQGTPIVEGAAGPRTTAEEAAFTELRKRIDAYVALQNRLEQQVPPRSKDATPEAIDRHQRALAESIRKERAAARQGEIFTPEVTRVVKAVLARVFAGEDGRQLRASIMDENPGPANVKVTVNGRYPDEVPLSTVPPQVLASLPKLPTDLEYRFVGERLVLLDVQAHIIVDFIDAALPA